MNRITIHNYIIIILLTAIITIKPQDRTVGLFLNDSTSFNGYTFFAPLAYINTYLIDNEGRLVHYWEGNHRPALAAYLLENGNLLRTAYIGNLAFPSGGSGGLIQEYDWDGNLIWEYEYSTIEYNQHHDVERLPNGNTLIIAWELKDLNECIEAGRNPALMSQNKLWPDHIIEVEKTGATTGNIVWEWHVWDHLIQDFDPTKSNYGVVSEHPELIDINYVSNLPHPLAADWNHINAVDYNEVLDQIILSIHHFGEVWIIDHSTTTQEAAGHTGGNSGIGGDLIYRWGNPQTYKRGNAGDQKLFGHHDAHWIKEGLPGENNILVFNNGRNRPGGDYSTIDEFTTPVDQNGNYPLNEDSTYDPDDFVWTYADTNPFDFFAPSVSGSQRLPNGNTLICSGTWGRFFEITNEGEMVWLYVNPVIASGPMYYEDPIPGTQNWVFRTYRYTPDYPGLDGRDLTPGDPIELYPTSAELLISDLTVLEHSLNQNYPNPFNPVTSILYSVGKQEFITLKIYDALGNEIATLVNEQKPAGTYKVKFSLTDRKTLNSGIYFYQLRAGSFVQTRKMILLK